MKLIKVVPKTQAMYYRLADNRIGVIYPNTGYIRVSPSWINDPSILNACNHMYCNVR